ncbi:unnamed protein product [Dicrocoelium dendriticum]|nr:unnamed protein product [Dicrocoelium dendriticum]
MCPIYVYALEEMLMLMCYVFDLLELFWMDLFDWCLLPVAWSLYGVLAMVNDRSAWYCVVFLNRCCTVAIWLALFYARVSGI